MTLVKTDNATPVVQFSTETEQGLRIHEWIRQKTNSSKSHKQLVTSLKLQGHEFNDSERRNQFNCQNNDRRRVILDRKERELNLTRQNTFSQLCATLTEGKNRRSRALRTMPTERD